MITLTKTFHHPLISQPFLSLGLTSLALLLLVLVLLSVPGPIKGMYWFSVEGQGTTEGPLSAGVLGWCCKLYSSADANSSPFVDLIIQYKARRTALMHPLGKRLPVIRTPNNTNHETY